MERGRCHAEVLYKLCCLHWRSIAFPGWLAMKPAPFSYHRPGSIAETIRLLATTENPKIIAGGQSLMAMMNFRYAMPDHLIDIARIPELQRIVVDDALLHIGAMTRQRDLEFSKAVTEAAPLFGAALRHVGHRQTRNRGTIGGSLAHADPSAELPTVCLAYDADIEIMGQDGSRLVTMRDFAAGFMSTAVGYDELLVSVQLPRWPKGHGYSFQEYARRHGDFAVVGAAVLLNADAGGAIDKVSIALCGVGDKPLRRDEAESLLQGRPLDKDSIQKAANLAADLKPIEDIHGTAAYRRHLARVLTGRALHEAWGRIGSAMGKAAA
jgi:aerobic carbon-monoxide dehydrogenase medium subunit